MSVNLIRYLNQVAICSLDGLRNHLPEIRQSDPELRFQGDEKILAHLGKNDGYYLNEKIFLNPELNDSEYQQTLVHELEHYRHRHFDQSREELISEILAYHAEDLWHNPDLRITRGYLKELIQRVRQITQCFGHPLSISDLPLPRVDLT